MIPSLMLAYVLAINGTTASVYGYREAYCGAPEAPEACVTGAVTSSGETFDSDVPSAAIAMPNNIRLRAGWVRLRLEDGECKPIRLNDRKNPRYIGSHSRIDLSPAAVVTLGGKPSPTWSGRVFLCIGQNYLEASK